MVPLLGQSGLLLLGLPGEGDGPGAEAGIGGGTGTLVSFDFSMWKNLTFI